MEFYSPGNCPWEEHTGFSHENSRYGHKGLMWLYWKSWISRTVLKRKLSWWKWRRKLRGTRMLTLSWEATWLKGKDADGLGWGEVGRQNLLTQVHTSTSNDGASVWRWLSRRNQGGFYLESLLYYNCLLSRCAMEKQQFHHFLSLFLISVKRSTFPSFSSWFPLFTSLVFLLSLPLLSLPPQCLTSEVTANLQHSSTRTNLQIDGLVSPHHDLIILHLPLRVNSHPYPLLPRSSLSNRL